MQKSILGVCFSCTLVLFALLSQARADLVSHWKLDGDVADSGPSGNDGVFRGDVAPTFVDGYDGTPGGAILFDGIDDLIEIVTPQNGLPISANPAFSVAMWVNGGPQQDRRVFAESSTTTRNPLFNIGTQNGGGTGQVDIYIRTAANTVVVNHALSAGEAFDNSWHHIAWVDENGQAVLYIDGVRDAMSFNYTKVDIPFDRTVIGGIVRNTPSHWFAGMIDDVRVYNHALTEFEILCLLPSGCPVCPGAGDTHCGSVSVTGPPGNVTGVYTVTASGAVDDSGNAILYSFLAQSGTGEIVTAGPQPGNSAQLALGSGTWAISVTVDDDPTCADEAPDATCVADPLTVLCPPEGDTHVSSIQVTAPVDGSAGAYTATAMGGSDDSGDAVTYTFRAEADTGLVIVAGPQAAGTVTWNLSEAEWTISVTADDDPDCPDAAPDNSASTQISVTCPAEGDTHCDDLVVTGPPSSTAGTYVATVQTAFDDSGDPVLFTFRAETADGRAVQVGPVAINTAELVLSAGTWTVRAFVDDNTTCFDKAPDAVCEAQVVVEGDPPGLISRWKFDGDTFDSEANANDGVFQGDAAPTFVDGFDGTPGGAILLDGIDDCVAVTQSRDLPLHPHEAFTIAMWVNGGPQPDFRIWSEGSSLTNTPLFTMGTDSTGATGQADIFIRSPARTVINHLRSQRNAFDNTWHHVAFTCDGGKSAMYIDGLREPTDLNHLKPLLALDRASIGCVLRAAASHFWAGAIDDARVYNYALSASEVLALVPPPPGCPGAGDTHCGALDVVGPGGGGEGLYTATVTGAVDDSGDAVIYTFTAEDGKGTYIQAGPQALNTASFNLFAGDWTIRASVDDDLGCRDAAGDASCTQAVAVSGPAKVLLSHWKLDGDLNDAQPSMNHGAFAGAAAPTFAEDRNGALASALSLDGADDYMLVSRQAGLPLYASREFSVALWVKGLPQPDRRLWSESSDQNVNALFNIGTQNAGATGQVDIFVRDPNGVAVVAHALSAGIAFDGEWHHVAWVDSAGNAVLYIDGKRDPAVFSYVRPLMPFHLTTIGGILRAATCCTFNGSIDDVRAYNYALSPEEVAGLTSSGPVKPRFHRADADDNGSMQLTDAVRILNVLFLGTGFLPCLDAADADDNGIVQLTDAVRILNVLFLGTGIIPLPAFPEQGPCGEDPTPVDAGEDIGCASFTSC